MAGQDNNTIVYEFQGNTLPLEKAFSKVGSLFRKFVKEAKQASDSGTLSPEQLALEKEFKNFYKRLKAYKEKKGTSAGLTKEEVNESERIYKELLKLADKFKKEQLKITKQKAKEQEKLEKEQEKRKEEVADYSSISSQFRAGMQVEQLHELTSNVQGIPPEVLSDIEKYVNAWKQVNEEYQKGLATEEELADATKALDETYKNYSTTLIKLERSQNKVVGAFENLSKRLITMVSSLEFWVRILKEGITLLGDYVESLNFLEVALRNVKFNTDKYADAIAHLAEQTRSYKKYLEDVRYTLGVNATEVNDAAATFISFANAMGLSGDTVVEFSKNISQLSADMASLYNRDVPTMAVALRSALAGNTRAMMKYGISVHDATINEWLLSKNMNLTMSQLSEASQVMARYLYIMEKTNAAQGDLARTIESPANQIKILKNQIKLLIQNIGAIANTVIYPMIRLLNTLLMPLNAFLTQLTALTSSNYSNALKATSDDMDDLADSIEDASDAAKGLTSLDEINQLSDKKQAKLGINEELQALADQMGVYDNFLGKSSKLVEVYRALGDALAPVYNMLFNSEGINYLIRAIDWIAGMFEPIRKFLVFIREKLDNAPNWIKLMIKGFGTINSVLSGLLVTILAVCSAMTTFKLLAGSKIFTTFIASLKTMWATFKNLAVAIWSAIKPLVTWIANLIKSAATAIITGIKNLFLAKTFWSVALGVIASAGLAAAAVAAAIGIAVAIGAATQKANEVTTESDAPRMAKGGVVTGPTFAMIGEGKYNEAVVPLGNSPQFISMKEDIADMVVNRTTNEYRNGSKDVVLNINGRELARAILPDLQNTLPQTGMKLRRA